MQRFVPEDGTSHYFTLRDDPQWHPTLVRLCAFDVVANNADRKSGHVLLAEERLWAIDNGLCFNEDDKLRTVIWDFGGEALAPDDLGPWSASPEGPCHRAFCELLTPRSWRRWAGGCRGCCIRALPELADDGGWPPYPWPSSERHARLTHSVTWSVRSGVVISASVHGFGGTPINGVQPIA